MKTLAEPRDKAEILRRLGAVHPDSPRRWGRMSAHQMVRHLIDSFAVMVGEKQASTATGVLQRTVVKFMALWVPLRWPTDVPTRPEVDQVLLGGNPGSFREDADRLATLLERITTHTERFDGNPHPIFGKLSTAAWLRWGYLHTDHHLRQFGA